MTTSHGFFRPTTTPTPDEIFDVWLSRLSGSELKVLLYIVRRTLGFKKDKDSISLAQICNGITTRDGRILDRGTGISKTTAYKAVNKLEKLGLVTVERSKTEDESNAVNVYSLRFRAFGEPGVGNGDDGPSGGLRSDQEVGQKLTQGGSKTNPGVGQKETPQQTVNQQTGRQQTDTQPPVPPESDSTAELGLSAGGVGPQRLTPAPGAAPPSLNSSNQLGARERAVEQLVTFGVWRSRAERAVCEHNLSPEFVERACAALERERTQGARFDNVPAVLLSRLAAGWSPPKRVVGDSSDGALGEPQSPPSPKRPRNVLPPIMDASGVECNVYQWFEAFKDELRLQLPRETFDAWLRAAQLGDYRPPTTEQRGELIIHLRSRTAMEWVKHRLHKVIQRLAARMAGVDLAVRYSVCPITGSNSELRH